MKEIRFNQKHAANNRKSRRGGSTIVIMAAGMTALLGCTALAVDYGLLVNDANRAQRAADAAALAGANELCKTGGCENTTPTLDTNTWSRIEFDKEQARYMARKVAAENGLTITDADIQLIPVGPLGSVIPGSFPGVPATRIRVTPQITRNLFFARAIGANSASLARSAMAGRVAIRGVAGAVPLAITTNDYNTNKDGRSFELKLIRNQDTNFDPTTGTALDLRPDNSGKAVNVFEEDLKAGYGGTIYLNQQINSALNAEIPSQGAKLESALQWRINQAAGAPWYDNGSNYSYPDGDPRTPDYPVGDPRIITLIVADPNLANNSNPMITARHFVSVYIENVRSPGSQGVYFRIRILPTRGYNSQDPNIVIGDGNTAITGPSAVTLMN
jgi:hypothetical protein